MVSFWWLVLAFICGGSAGILLTALMGMSGGLPEQSQNVADLNTSRDADLMGPVTQW